jgi:hypothetical protein
MVDLPFSCMEMDKRLAQDGNQTFLKNKNRRRPKKKKKKNYQNRIENLQTCST